MFKFNLQMFANTTVPAALVKKAWAKQLWKEAQKDNFFAKFTGEGPENIIQVKTELKKDKGDKITIPLVMNLTGAGVTGDNQLEGNEEALQFYDCAVEVDQIRHAVRLQGRMEEHKTQINLRAAAKEGLKNWLVEKTSKEKVLLSLLFSSSSRIIISSVFGSFILVDMFSGIIVKFVPFYFVLKMYQDYLFEY